MTKNNLLILLAFIGCYTEPNITPMKTGNPSIRAYTQSTQAGLTTATVKRIKKLLETCDDFKVLRPQQHSSLVSYNKRLNVFFVTGGKQIGLCGVFLYGPSVDTIEVYTDVVNSKPPESPCGIIQTTAHELLHAAGLLHDTSEDDKMFDNLVDQCVFKRWTN